MLIDSGVVIAIKESTVSMLCKNFDPIIPDWLIKMLKSLQMGRGGLLFPIWGSWGGETERERKGRRRSPCHEKEVTVGE